MPAKRPGFFATFVWSIPMPAEKTEEKTPEHIDAKIGEPNAKIGEPNAKIGEPQPSRKAVK